jgi:transcriptional regulator with XRE-family HTH domain
MAEGFSEVAQLIKELRREKKLTQVQLANELGLSPATVYRYESGARPDQLALLRLLQFAEKVGAGATANAFRNLLPDQTILLVNQSQPVFKGDRLRDNDSEAFLRTLGRIASKLSGPEKLQLLAFLLLLRGNTDRTVEKILTLMLEPWVERATQEFNWPNSPQQKPSKDSEKG